MLNFDPFRSIEVNGSTLVLGTENSKSVVKLGDKTYTKLNLSQLQIDVPLLKEKSHMWQLAVIANFLFTGQNYTVIEKASEFPSKEFGSRDVSQIREPYQSGSEFVFFAERNGVPYKVTFGPYPFKNGVKPNYELLPEVPVVTAKGSPERKVESPRT